MAGHHQDLGIQTSFPGRKHTTIRDLKMMADRRENRGLSHEGVSVLEQPTVKCVKA
jgi:hypothetical protein